MSGVTAKWTRIFFAGPGAFLIALVIMAGMTQWVPEGPAKIDNLIVPLVFLPLIWAGLFFHAILDSKLWRVVLAALALFAIHSGLVVMKFMEVAQ